MTKTAFLGAAAALCGVTGCTTPQWVYNGPITGDPVVDGKAMIAACPPRDKVLYQYRTVTPAMRTGHFDEAKQILDDALLELNKVPAQDKAARQARSTFAEESIKGFRGEPYERVMANYYRGILYWMDGEWDNARACFLNAQVQDSDTEKKEYSSDYVLLEYLSGLAMTKMGNDGSDALKRAQSFKRTPGPAVAQLNAPAPRPWLGVEVATLAEREERAKLREPQEGALILSLSTGAPAEQAGLKTMDVVTAVDGVAVKAAIELSQQLQQHNPRDQVTLEVWREGNRQNLTVALGEAPSSLAPRLIASSQGDPPPYNPNANIVVFLEFGNGPTKYSTGQYKEQLRFHPGVSDDNAARLTVDGQTLVCRPYDDLNFQATTRGGRVMDHVLANKAVFKTTSNVAGDIALITGAIGTGNSDADLALLAAGALLKIMSAASTPAADTRAWDGLPQWLSFCQLQLPPGPHTATVEFLGSTGSPLPTLTKTINFTVVPPPRDTVLFISDKNK